MLVSGNSFVTNRRQCRRPRSHSRERAHPPGTDSWNSTDRADYYPFSIYLHEAR